MLNGILGLGAKSLLTADVSDDNVIYRLLDTTRAYAREKLRSSDESAKISRRHAVFLCGVRDGANGQAPSDAAWLEKYGPKIDDVRAALDWCFSPDGDAWLGQRLTAASGPLWFGLYALSEYGRRLQQALQALHAAATPDAALEMRLNMMLGNTHLHTGAPGMATAFNTAIEIADRLGDTATLGEALFGSVYQSVLAGDYLSAVRSSERALRRVDGRYAEAAFASDSLIALAHHLAGNQVTARRHAERALSRDSDEPIVARANWLDYRVSARAFLSLILWVQGFPDQSTIAAHRCVEDALSAGHSLMSALLRAGMVALWTGDMAAADRFVAMLLDRSARHSLTREQLWGRSFATVLAFRRGDTERKVARRDEMLSDPLSGPPLLETLGTLSEDLVGAEAVARAKDGRAGWCAAEILRANAAAMLKQGTLDEAAAETQFRRSLDIASRQGALSWELRAATSLARLWQGQGRVGDAHDLLASVLGRFTEGFGTADLLAAKALLNELAI